MRKIIFLILFLLISFAAFSENVVAIKKIEFDEMTRSLYVEAEYQLDECIYVPVALCESGGICNVENNTLKIIFYPRGNTIFRGDYSTLRGNRVQRISSGNSLIFRCHLQDVFYLSSMYDKKLKTFSMSDFDLIEFIFCEVGFESGQYIENDYLRPDWKGDKIYIYSEPIKLFNDGSSFKVSDETIKRIFPGK